MMEPDNPRDYQLDDSYVFVCPECGEKDSEIWMVDGIMMCGQCRKYYRIDHPDLEEFVAEAEYREDR